MCQFIIDELRVDESEALKIKNKYFHEHGTTLNGLMKKHNINAERFLEFVHDIDSVSYTHLTLPTTPYV